MAAYVAGDEVAFRQLFDRHSPALFRTVRKRLSTDDEAFDVVQQVFLNVHRAREAFRADAKLKPWLFTIALNLVREHYRKQKRRSELSFDASSDRAPAVDPRTPIEDFQQADHMRIALRRLKPAQREVIELRWFQDRSYDEISEIVGASVAAVRVRAHRGYQHLRGELRELN